MDLVMGLKFRSLRQMEAGAVPDQRISNDERSEVMKLGLEIRFNMGCNSNMSARSGWWLVHEKETIAKWSFSDLAQIGNLYYDVEESGGDGAELVGSIEAIMVICEERQNRCSTSGEGIPGRRS